MKKYNDKAKMQLPVLDNNVNNSREVICQVLYYEHCSRINCKSYRM